jgi:hypothetical protein
MWKNVAQALGIEIPEAQLETISPVLDSLWAGTRKALDRDLTAVDPAITFRPDLASEGEGQ